MQKLTANDPETKSPDLAAANLAALRALFPELVTEGPDGVVVNLDVLKQLVGDKTVTDTEEKYGLNWHGKRRARQLALTPSTGTLRPCPEDSVDWDTTQNLMIEGDNLEVLKLLQKSYAGKVKLIYIDPPYNTGKDFVYPDNFRDNIGNYLELTGQTGEGGKKLSSNTEASGRFHTDWLNMMYPRLKLARNLMREDGVMFISIDERELERLTSVCSELFGEDCVETYVWDVREPGTMPKTASKTVRKVHEYIVAVFQNSGYAELRKYQDYKYINNDTWGNPDNDLRGPWMSGNMSRGTSSDGDGENTFAITSPSGQSITRTWSVSRQEYDKLLADGRIFFASGGEGVPRRKIFKNEPVWAIQASIFENLESSQSAASALKDMLGEQVFDYPKPVKLLSRILSISLEDNDLVIDFFAGSGTIAHAVMAQNASDGGNRKYILVQLPEPLDPENKDQNTAANFCDKLGKPRTIAELTKERLRRAGKKIREEWEQKKQKEETRRRGEEGTLALDASPLPPVTSSPLLSAPPDTGFRVFKLASSNIRAWEPDRDKLAETLEASIEHLKTDRTEQDILFELLLKLGLDLCVPIETRKVEGGTKQAHEIHSIGGGSLLVCLSPAIPQADVEPLALGLVAWHKALKPAGETTVVFRDSAFADDVAKTNLTAILQQHGLEIVRSL